jgi:hypothetical protein
MARNDIHHPSALVPSEYDFVSFEYLGEDDMDGKFRREVIAAHKARTGGFMSDHEHGGSCHICGAHALYTVIFYHGPSNAYIRTGLDCAEKMDLACDDAVSFRKTVKAGLEAVAGKKKAIALLASLNLSPAWDVYVSTENSGYKNEEFTICSMVANLIKYGNLSDKQVNFMRVLVQKIADRATAAANSNFVGTVGKREVFDLVLVFNKTYETAYGLMTVTGFNDKAGNTFIYKGSSIFVGLNRGAKVSVKATMKDHSEYNGVKQNIIARPFVM